MSFTEEEKRQALTYAANGADFMFIPSSDLCKKIISGSEETQGINQTMTAILLEKKPIRLDPTMIIRYCRGTLDKKNTWLFNNGYIKVVPHQYKKSKKLKEDKKGEKNDK